MTGYQWAMLGLGTLGFLLTWTGLWFGMGRAVEQMTAGLENEIDAERLARLEAFDKLREDFAASQRSQDHNFGEVGAAMRQYVTDVEKKVREVEIWGRDHYVQKSDFDRATEIIRQDIREMTRAIKEDVRNLNDKIIDARR